MRSFKAHGGFTLIELLVVVLLIGVSAAVAVPSFSRMVDANRRASASNDMAGLLSFARSEAIRRGSSISVYALNPGDANSGYGVCVGASLAACKGGSATELELLKSTNELPGTITVSQTTPSVADDLQFNGRGVANRQFVYRVCGEPGTEAVEIAVNLGGQIRINNNAGVACP